MTDLASRIAACRHYLETELFVPETGLIYDYRSSREHTHRFDHVPCIPIGATS